MNAKRHLKNCEMTKKRQETCLYALSFAAFKFKGQPWGFQILQPQLPGRFHCPMQFFHFPVCPTPQKQFCWYQPHVQGHQSCGIDMAILNYTGIVVGQICYPQGSNSADTKWVPFMYVYVQMQLDMQLFLEQDVKSSKPDLWTRSMIFDEDWGIW